jgi:dolichol-phosphate mannosyltransferase
VKFGTVGASGFIVNMLVYRLLIFDAGVHYLPAAVGAFCVAVTNNFLWNRLWTFRRHRGSLARFQAARFLTVSVSALLPNLLLLRLFVETVGLDRVAAQVVAVCLVMPITFLGNKLWSFR